MKKQRGKKRKLRAIEQRLTEATSVFPTSFYAGLYSFKLPAGQNFIEALRQQGVDRIAKYLLESAATLKQLKPHNAYKIVVLLFPNNMWYSEIIVFEHAPAFNEFFSRQIETSFWHEQQALHAVTYSHWTLREFIESERNERILCYIER